MLAVADCDPLLGNEYRFCKFAGGVDVSRPCPTHFSSPPIRIDTPDRTISAPKKLHLHTVIHTVLGWPGLISSVRNLTPGAAILTKRLTGKRGAREARINAYLLRHPSPVIEAPDAIVTTLTATFLIFRNPQPTLRDSATAPRPQLLNDVREMQIFLATHLHLLHNDLYDRNIVKRNGRYAFFDFGNVIEYPSAAVALAHVEGSLRTLRKASQDD